MSFKKFASSLLATTASDGSRALAAATIYDVSMSKGLATSVAIEDTDSDTRVVLGLLAGPDAEHLVRQSDIYDSGDSNGVKRGTIIPTNPTDVTRFAVVRVELYVEKLTAGSGQKTAVLSAWVGGKPF